MKIALFGGTFDPVHLGHLAVARAAARKFSLDKVYFVPADIPPHKQKRALTDYHHRFAMLALATAGELRFVASLIDAPAGQPNYSYETVLRLKQTLRASDKLYFLIGIDAFKEISTWYKPAELLAECDFIVVSRPGFSLADIVHALPSSLRVENSLTKKTNRVGIIQLSQSKIHVLDKVDEPASSTEIRRLAGKSHAQLKRFVPRAVAEYIKKQGLYAAESALQSRQGRRRGKIATSTVGNVKDSHNE